MKPNNRKLLQEPEFDLQPNLSPEPFSAPINGTSIANHKPIKPNMPFDSSMALTILVLVTALFFMGFFSIYIRRFADENPVDVSRRRRNQGGPPRQSFPPSRFNPQKGLDPSTVQSLPLVSYRGDAKYPIDCVVCLSEFEEGETVKLIPYCQHVFHPDCVDTWLSSRASCPLCRSSQMFLAGGEESCFGVVQSGLGHGVSELEERSTVIDVDTWIGEVGSVGIRRTSSCSSLGDRTVIQRTTSL